MDNQPRFDIAAAFGRQFIVDVSMELVFGNGNLRIGHGRRLFSISIVPLFFPSAFAGERKQDCLRDMVSSK
jgi:hypothetical protein